MASIFAMGADRRAVIGLGQKIFGKIDLGVREKLGAGHRRFIDQDA